MFFFLLFFFLSSSGFADSWSDQAEKTVKKTLAELPLPEKHFGVWMSRGDEVVSVNETKLFIPASLTKIPTALAFLNHRFESPFFHTWIYGTGPIVDGVLKGDLYLKGGGDPSLVNETLWTMIRELKRSGIKKVEGRLFVDDSYFDSDYYPEGRQEDRAGRAYSAPVGALSFNWNALSIYVRPGGGPSAPAVIHVDPPLDFIQVTNRVKTTKGGRTKIQIERTLKDQKILLNVSGKIPLSSGEKVFYRSIDDPALWTGYSFKFFLNQWGVVFTGKVEKKPVPPKARLLIEQESWNRSRILSALSKFSNNYIAGMLTKHLGKSKKTSGNISDGLVKIKEFLKKQGWKDSEFQLVNPSGLTRDNKLRVDRLGLLLKNSMESFRLMPEFLVSLPISGVDGTLKLRMTQFMKEKVRAKTGHIAGVVGLAGFMESPKDKKTISFALLYNGPSLHDWKVQSLFDKLLWRIYLIRD